MASKCADAPCRRVNPRRSGRVLTALDREDSKSKRKRIGAVRYMTKPFDPEQLIKAIKDEARTTDIRSANDGEHASGSCASA